MLTIQDSQLFSNLSQAIQLYVDHHYFQTVVRGVENLIGSISYRTNSSIRLDQAREMWADSLHQSKRLLFKIIEKKINDILPPDLLQRALKISSSSSSSSTSSSIPMSLSSLGPSRSLQSASVSGHLPALPVDALTDFSIYLQGLETMTQPFGSEVQREIAIHAGSVVISRFLSVLQTAQSFDRGVVSALREGVEILKSPFQQQQQDERGDKGKAKRKGKEKVKEKEKEKEGESSVAREELLKHFRSIEELLDLLLSSRPEEFLDESLRELKFSHILFALSQEALLDILLSYRPVNPSAFSKLVSRLKSAADE